jgi:hypothetical protein
MQRTNIYLDDSQVADLDRITRDEAISRAAVIRRLTDRGLGERAELATLNVRHFPMFAELAPPFDPSRRA